MTFWCKICHCEILVIIFVSNATALRHLWYVFEIIYCSVTPLFRLNGAMEAMHFQFVCIPSITPLMWNNGVMEQYSLTSQVEVKCWELLIMSSSAVQSVHVHNICNVLKCIRHLSHWHIHEGNSECIFLNKKTNNIMNTWRVYMYLHCTTGCHVKSNVEVIK